MTPYAVSCSNAGAPSPLLILWPGQLLAVRSHCVPVARAVAQRIMRPLVGHRVPGRR
jgi:hypothetical protein